MLSHRHLNYFMIAVLSLALPQVMLLFTGETLLTISSDVQLHLDRTIAITTEIENGYLWPRWSHYLHGGYGSPLFNYYPAGFYLLGGWLHLLTGLSHKIILSFFVLVILFLRPLGAYLFARELTDPPSALVASAVYTWMPFHFRELLVQMNLPQFSAIALMPFILWAFIKLLRHQNLKWLILSTGLFASLILTHHLSAFLFAPVLIGFVAVYVWVYVGSWRGLLIGGVAVILGLMLSTIYWLPALNELNLTQIDTIQDQSFQIESNYIEASFLLAPIVPLDHSWLNWTSYYGSLGPRAGWGNLLMIGLAIFIGIVSNLPRPLKILSFLSVGLALFSLFMITPNSAGIWDQLPLINYIQFPWRFLLLFGVALILPTALVIFGIPKRWKMLGAGGLIIILFVSILPLLYTPIQIMSAGEVSHHDVLKREQQTGNIATTASNEYLPKWALIAPLRTLDEQELDALHNGQWRIWIDETTLPPQATVTSIRHQEGVSRYRITTDQTFDLAFMQLYFPSWDVRLDNQPQTIMPMTDSGLLGVTIPKGSYELSVHFGMTKIQKIGTFITILTIGSIFFIGLIMIIKRIPKSEQQQGKSQLAYAVIIGIIAYLILDAIIIRPHTTLFHQKNSPLTPPAQQIVDVAFGDSLGLVGYDITPKQARAGDRIHVRLYWRLLNTPSAEMLRSAVHITERYGINSYGSSNAFHIGAIPIQAWTFDQYVTDDHFITLDNDTPPFQLEVRVSVFDEDGNYLLADSEQQQSVVIQTIALDGNWHQIEMSDLIMEVIHFNEAISLLGYHWQTNDTETCLTLRWQMDQPALPELTVMLHFLDEAGEMVHVEDAPPLNGQYPTQNWRVGQQLDDKHCFDMPAEAETLLIGLYDAITFRRLTPTTLNGTIFEHQAFALSLP